MRREPGVRLERQVVDGQVRRAQRQRDVQVAAQLREALLRQRVHQVEVEGLEEAGRRLDRGAGLRRVVDAADALQRRVVEALHADRQPRHPGRAIGLEALALEGAGVGLQRDLGQRLQRQARADVRQQPVDAGRIEQAGRTAADEHADHAPAPDQRQAGFQVGSQRIQVGRFGKTARP